jgi:pimeloyl-ACP methyl ester carboxylesterase
MTGRSGGASKEGIHMQRPTTRRSLIATALAAVLALAGFVAPSSSVGAQEVEPDLPIIFVHGAFGSGAQYETQALRWASNDYPNEVTAIDRVGAFAAQMDAFIDDVLARTGDDQVYVVGHSAGTALMNGYLNSSPERAARVAKYIGIDGAQAATCPGDVPCMGIWGRGNPDRALGPVNVHFPEQGHTEVVTSAQPFVEQYRFFTGEDPDTTLVLPEAPGRVEIAGRALNFPFNTGVDGAILQVWEVNGSTGARTTSEPIAEVELDASGDFGPIPVNGLQRHEITLVRHDEAGPRHQHFYYEPWTRSNYLLRLNVAPIGSALDQAIERGPHGSVSIVRMKEWWGNNPVDPANADDLHVSSTSASLPDQAPIDIINENTAPFTSSTIAVIAFDINSDGVTDVSQLHSLGPFLSGVDLYMPGTDPPDGMVTFDHQQRRTDAPQVINTPNWATEAGHGMTVTFREYVQDIETWGQCKQARIC